ncbi:MAG: hypothetical protein AABX07_02640 [Nanoarchaeota archaeon]
MQLSISEAARLQQGDRVIYYPAGSDKPCPNQQTFRNLKFGESYTIKGVKIFGLKKHSHIPQELKAEDLEGRTITDEHKNPLTNVPLLLEGIEGMYWYGYFRK